MMHAVQAWVRSVTPYIILPLSIALSGAQAELRELPIREKARRLAQYARLMLAGAVGFALQIPYGFRALLLHKSLSSDGAQEQQLSRAPSVRILRDVRYGCRPRNVLDVYLPAMGASEVSGRVSPAPLVLFCHGGVWASGAKWHYSPIATRLAQEGVIAVIMQYTLCPQALVSEMAEEVNLALSWALDHAKELGSHPSKVSLVGQSAGAHLCALALLRRSLLSMELPAQEQQPQNRVPGVGGRSGGERPESSSGAGYKDRGGELPGTCSDGRMPALFVGMGGVYDAAEHYNFEQERGVHEISPMKPAFGGVAGFGPNSPAMILAAVLEQQQGSQEGASRYAAGDAAMLQLPRVVLMSSQADVTVRWTQSEKMHQLLQQAGIDSQHRQYLDLAHSDFVVQWQPKSSLADEEKLSGFAADLVQLLKGERI